MVSPNILNYVTQTVKHLPVVRETWIRSLGREDPWRRKWQPTPVLLPGKLHGLRSLVGYSPLGSQSRTRLSDFTGHRSCQKYSCREKNLHAIHENFKLLLMTGKFYFFFKKSQLFIYYFSGHSFISFQFTFLQTLANIVHVYPANILRTK